jgi:hypothetical protein
MLRFEAREAPRAEVQLHFGVIGAGLVANVFTRSPPNCSFSTSHAASAGIAGHYLDGLGLS